ncbi:TPA: KilA-N domain-containing protein [Vibrio cholerae]|nr:KilA-N domain-containing protein [Vibrio cholerae]
MKTLQLTFDGRTVYTTAIEHNGQEFFNLNDIFNASTEVKPSKRPANWRNKLSHRYREEDKMVVLGLRKNEKVVVLSGAQKCEGGKTTEGTWYGTQEVVIAYSQWLQADFAYVVNAAFSALVDGDK